MNRSIQLDRHLRACAIEVDDKTIDYLLASEMQSCESVGFQSVPQCMLVGGRILPKLPRQIELLSRDILATGYAKVWFRHRLVDSTNRLIAHLTPNPSPFWRRGPEKIHATFCCFSPFPEGEGGQGFRSTSGCPSSAAPRHDSAGTGCSIRRCPRRCCASAR
jgi:hypothetical protein